MSLLDYFEDLRPTPPMEPLPAVFDVGKPQGLYQDQVTVVSIICQPFDSAKTILQKIYHELSGNEIDHMYSVPFIINRILSIPFNTLHIQLKNRKVFYNLASLVEIFEKEYTFIQEKSIFLELQ